MRRARWKRKNVRDDLTPPCQITQNGAGRHALPTKLETLLPAALYLNLKSVRPRTCSTAHNGVQIGHPLLLFPLPLPRPSSLVPLGVGFQRRGPRPPAFVSFQGVRGEIEIPPRFSLGGPGGKFSFQKRISPWLLRTEPVQFRREFWPHVGASNQTVSPYIAQVLLSVTFTSMNCPISSLPPFSRTSRLPSVREARVKFSSSLSPSTSTRTVLPT